MKFFGLLLMTCFFAFSVFAQDSILDNEMKASEGATLPPDPAAQANEETKAPPPPEITEKPSSPALQETFDPNEDRFPKNTGQFVKPPAPLKGDSLRVKHPLAEKGLTQINADGSYQYKIKPKDKSKAGSIKFMSMSPPKITGSSGDITYDSMYGKSAITGALFDYEWQPFTGFGRMGIDLGFGVATVRGNGTFKKSGAEARETYTLYMVPLSAFLVYRFEYARKQWLVPFVNGGVTYFGLSENRDDGKKPSFLGAGAAGGGGGILISISNMDPRGSFAMEEEYGISDLWLTIEARALKGFNKETDFTTNMVNVGFTMDY